jgi:hypothetical protein
MLSDRSLYCPLTRSRHQSCHESPESGAASNRSPMGVPLLRDCHYFAKRKIRRRELRTCSVRFHTRASSAFTARSWRNATRGNCCGTPRGCRCGSGEQDRRGDVGSARTTRGGCREVGAVGMINVAAYESRSTQTLPRQAAPYLASASGPYRRNATPAWPDAG